MRTSELPILTATRASLSDERRTLDGERLALSNERQRLATSIKKLSQDLLRETGALALLRASLEEARSAPVRRRSRNQAQRNVPDLAGLSVAWDQAAEKGCSAAC